MIKLLKINLISSLILLSQMGLAQIQMPAPSPWGKVIQNVGLAEISVEYSRPSLKGREIFGELLPYGEVWRTGANAATLFTVSENIRLEGKEIPKGSYAVFSIPGEEEWTIILSKDIQAWGEGAYDASNDLVRFTVQPTTPEEEVETLTFAFEELGFNTADLTLAWENTKVTMAIETEAEKQVMTQIQEALNPSVDAGTFFQAANFYYQTNRDLKQALEWIDKAVELYEKENRNVYWVVHTKAKIEAELGKYKAAIATAQKAKSMAEKGNNQHYVKLNEDAIAEWKKNN